MRLMKILLYAHLMPDSEPVYMREVGKEQESMKKKIQIINYL